MRSLAAACFNISPKLLAAAVTAFGMSVSTHALDVSGNINIEHRAFADDVDKPQHSQYASIGALVELYHAFEDTNESFTFTAFYRGDQYDEERSHGDIREALLITVGDGWELRSGIGKVFWGVTESQHLVDIINQTDLVEATDGEEKLGQVMLNLTLIRDWGNVDIFYLPYFRERTFPGVEGRPGPRNPSNGSVIKINTEEARYEDSLKSSHADFALRWSHSYDDLDLAVSWFSGTSRDPFLIPNTSGELEPFYAQMSQLGLEAQWLVEAWTYKLEVVQRSYDQEALRALQGLGSVLPGTNLSVVPDDYLALVGGFEYTVFGLFSSNADLGLISEYHFDDRNEAMLSAFQNDLFFGARLAFNDAESTSLLTGVIYDIDNGGQSWVWESSRRISDTLSITVNAQILLDIDAEDLLFSYADDDFVQAEINWYF